MRTLLKHYRVRIIGKRTDKIVAHCDKLENGDPITRKRDARSIAKALAKKARDGAYGRLLMGGWMARLSRVRLKRIDYNVYEESDCSELISEESGE